MSSTLLKVIGVIETVLPKTKRRTATEEAGYEDEGTLTPEMLQCKFPNILENDTYVYIFLSSTETLRVSRPRIVI